MSRVSFNRKRVKLKQLLGIRARLALLARDPGGALDAGTRPFARGRPRQADRAASRGILQPRAAQRRCPARSHLFGRDDAEIGGLYPRLGRRHQPQLRHPARQPADQSAVDSQPPDRGGDGRVQCSTNNSFVGLDLSDRPYFKKAQASGDFVFSDFLLSRPAQDPMVMAAYPVSAINSDVGRHHFRRRQSRLDVEADEQSRRPARHFRGAGR